jgi:hypothetical protein
LAAESASHALELTWRLKRTALAAFHFTVIVKNRLGNSTSENRIACFFIQRLFPTLTKEGDAGESRFCIAPFFEKEALQASPLQVSIAFEYLDFLRSLGSEATNPWPLPGKERNSRACRALGSRLPVYSRGFKSSTRPETGSVPIEEKKFFERAQS